MDEANTKYFQARATIKHKNNHIAIPKDEGDQEHHDHQAKVAIMFKAVHYFCINYYISRQVCLN